MKSTPVLQRLGYWLVTGLIFIVPLFFLPVTSEYYEFNKQALLVISSLILLGILVASFITDKTVRIVRNPLGLPILALMASWLLSTFLKTPNHWDSFTDPGQTTTIIALSVFFMAAVNFIRTKKDLEFGFNSLLTSTGILSVLTILWGSNLFSKFLPIAFLKSPLWTPTGSPLGTLVFLITIAVALGFVAVKNRTLLLKNFTHLLVLVLAVIASGILGFRLFGPNSNARPLFLSQTTSWAIALEALKNSPIWGTGPSTYLSDFTRFRPVTFNLTSNWGIRFNSSSNQFLQILTTLGMVGLAVYVFIFVKVAHMGLKSLHLTSESSATPLSFALPFTILVYMISWLFIPPSFVNLFLLFVMFALATAAFRVLGSSLVHESNIDIVAASEDGSKSPILPFVLAVLVIALAAPTIFYGSKIYLADYYFGQSLNSAAANKAKDTYDLLVKALTTNPRRDTYRLAYSQTNMILANALAGKQNITPEERNTVTQLIQQAIQEAKNGVSLNPGKVTNIENLASIYRNLLGVAQGADSWTVASYRQAIVLDPINPNLRIALGGVLYALKNYDESIRVFQQAVDLKPNLPNAYYNLSAAYREKGDFQNSFTAMQVVTNLVDKSSADYSKAVGELEELRKKLPQAAAPAQVAPQKTELEAPKPIPSPKATPIKLPAELGPEASPAPTTTP